MSYVVYSNSEFHVEYNLQKATRKARDLSRRLGITVSVAIDSNTGLEVVFSYKSGVRI